MKVNWNPWMVSLKSAGFYSGAVSIGCLLLAVPAFAHASKPSSVWKAGVARDVITPEQPMWLAGYAGRTRPAEGKRHDLWVKALALEDRKGTRAVVISADLLGMSRPMYERLRGT